ncbi:conjugative relaxase-like TrwC/TraI family protein [Haloferula luteola]|uniref:Conjugative relaxase-like TrwC/TraI family protein n=1 Tax=Haloferula luteola TaxID=595692 RepID=A0A840VJA4_9BACT|nr:MobF family relaxase [Haloferula luteola]MBB5353869.1 conjugative relaxase-like TrwC/TraI family protein [Haloferula luteola]
MITVTQIRGGADYMGRHLSMNDYYSEHERVVGYWQGDGAELLGLKGQEVTSESFEALRANRHPQTGEKLRPRSAQVAFHDFVISAPKSVSIVAVTGGDERLAAAYEDCVQKAFERLEAMAAVRRRQGALVRSEDLAVTGNGVAAVFHHNTSRMLDPQLHSHLVFANLSYDPERGGWFALQPRLMAEASARSIRGQFHRDLERACRDLGYRTESVGESFRLADLNPSHERHMSQRAIQREFFEQRYRELFGTSPDKKRVEQFIKDRKQAATQRFEREYHAFFGRAPSSKTTADFVRDWRSDKMATSSVNKVQALQQQRLGAEGWEDLKRLVRRAKATAHSSAENTGEKVIEQSVKKTTQAHALTNEVTVSGEKQHAAITAGQSPSASPAQGPNSRTSGKLHNGKTVSLEAREALRRYRRGMALAAAMRGHPQALLRIQLRAQRRRHES